MYQLKEGDLLNLLKDIPENELKLGFRSDRVTTTLGTLYAAYEDGDIVYSYTYTYCNQSDSLIADLLYRLLSNQLPPIRLYLIPTSTGRDIILSKADRLIDLFWFLKNSSTISGYRYRDLGHHKFRLRQHPVECFYFDSKTVDREYVSTLLDVPSVFYPETQQTSKA